MTEIDVKQAVRLALQYARDVFETDKLSNVGLEEVEKIDDTWVVTVGFSRPWDYPKPVNPLDPLAQFRQTDSRPRRDYKVVRIDARTGEVEAVKNRE